MGMKCSNLCCVQDVQLHPFVDAARSAPCAITSFCASLKLEALEVSYFIDSSLSYDYFSLTPQSSIHVLISAAPVARIGTL